MSKKFRNFTATVFSQLFRQINVLLKDFTYTVNQFDEKNLRGSEGNSLSLTHFWQKFRESNGYVLNKLQTS